MAVFSGTLYSEMLGKRTPVEVIFPSDELGAAPEEPVAVFYFLHGLTDNSGAYNRWTNLAWLTRRYHIAAIMPDVDRSWYMDMEHGGRYFSYLTQELPSRVQQLFRLPTRSFIVGNSMGGYGALKALLRCSGQYEGAAGLSGAYDLPRVLAKNPALTGEFQAILGQALALKPEDDIYALAEQATLCGKRIYLACGTEDDFLPDTERLHEGLLRRSIAHCTRYAPGGHDWDCWNAQLAPAIEYLLNLAPSR
ncbi:MAG: alpha/beta hydrolase-fold protein [Clostridia bacterium]